MKKTNPELQAIPLEELAAIKDSVERAWMRLVKKMQNIHKPKRFSKKPVETGSDFNRQTHRHHWERWLKSKRGQREIMAAARAGDVDYFLQKADVMSGAWLSTPIYRPPQLDVFLISHWTERRDGFPELFRLTPSDLTSACCQHLGDDSLNQEHVVKTRQRLGLKAFRPGKIHPKYGLTGMTFPDMDK